MDFNIEVRRKQLENIDQFINSSKSKVDSILKHLGWTAEKTSEKQKEMVKCLINSEHRVPSASVVKHIQSCTWRKENYCDTDVPLSEPNFLPGSSILIDDPTKTSVLNAALLANPVMKTGWRVSDPVPRTSNRLLSAFSPDERLVLYEYAVKSTKGPPKAPEFKVMESHIEEKHTLTPTEIKALERDAKRRRIKYKSRSIHTCRKSTTEILRELIEGQMELYEDWWKIENGIVEALESEHEDDESAEPLKANTKRLEIDESERNSNHETGSPRSSRSQNSYESRYRNSRYRSRSKERSRQRSRSHSRFSDKSREYSSRRRQDDRYNRRYESSSRYKSRDYRSDRDRYRSKR